MLERIKGLQRPSSANIAAFSLFCVCAAGVAVEVDRKSPVHKQTRPSATALPTPRPSSKALDTLAVTPTANTVPAVAPASGPINGIEIIGNTSCRNDIFNALGLLAAKAPKDLQTVEKYIKVIACVPSGSGIDAATSEFMLGNAERTDGTPWLASTILHDATHSRLYHTYEATHPGEAVPDDIWIGKKAEEICLAAQAEDLTEIGAPQSEIDYVKNDAIKTGYWQVPQAQRTW